jgi:hypothetical protein
MAIDHLLVKRPISEASSVISFALMECLNEAVVDVDIDEAAKFTRLRKVVTGFRQLHLSKQRYGNSN